MTNTDLMTLLNLVGGLPLHTILFVAVAVLWRRLNRLEAELVECLKKNEQEQRLQDFMFTKK